GTLPLPPPHGGLRPQQLVACAPVFARLTGEVHIRVEDHSPPLVHVAWFALESHCFHPFLCSELLPCGDTLRGDTPSFGFAGQSVTAACSVMLAGPKERIFTDRIFKPPFYERTYISTRQTLQCTTKLSNKFGL